MSKLFTLLLFLCIHQFGNAQFTVEGIVIDVETQKAVPYINVGIISSSKGTVSDDDGTFVLRVESENDIVTFSGIGYETKNIAVREFLAQPWITLTPKAYAFEAVEIVSNKFEDEKVILGVRNKNRGLSIGFGSAQLGTEIGAPIKIKKPSFLKTANFVFNHAKGDSVLLRINIYEFEEGTIGKNLLPENVIIRAKQKKGKISVDLKEYNLVVESDVLLTLEWLRDFDENGNKGLTFDTKKAKKPRGIFVRYSSNGKFEMTHAMKKRKLCFYFEASQIKK